MIVRIDDYPTGIRPILPGQLEVYDSIIYEFVKNDIPIHLGIVPVTYSSLTHVLDITGIIPCCHGYNHKYLQFSNLLMKKGDPFNTGTIGIFDEFDGCSDAEISGKLIYGKMLLERMTGVPVDTFIPVCNVIDSRLARLIYMAGYKRILCENICQSPIPIIKSDFYGKLIDIPVETVGSVFTFHVTWEYDTIMRIGFDSWSMCVKAFKQRHYENLI